MIKILRIIPLLLLHILALHAEQKDASIKRLTLNLQEGDPPTLHPYKGIDLRSRCLFLALYEPLMRRTPAGNIEPAAANRVEVDASKTIYTFHLRPHQWSNGKPVTSHHFAQAWKYALDPSSPCIRADLFYPIKNAEKVKRGLLPIDALKIFTPDETTLIVELEHPTPYFLDLTATSFFCPLYESSDKEPLYFNGPFLIDDWIHNQTLILCQNPKYWDLSSLTLQEVCFTMVKDPMTALAMYEKGDLDLIGDPFSTLPFDAIPSLMKDNKLKTKLISRIFYLLINTTSPPMDNKSLRKALALSIDRQELTEHLFIDEIPSLSLLPQTLSMLSLEEIQKIKEDAVSLFEQALSELGLNREKFPKIIINYANLSGQKNLAEFIQEQWRKKLGIKTELICSEWNVHTVNLRKKNYQIGALHLTTLYQDPMFYFDLFRDKASLSNYCGWENLGFRSLLEKSEKVIEENKRCEYLKQAEKRLFEEMPAIPIFTQQLQYLTQDHIDLAISDLGIYDFKRTKIRN
jgi:oligopeptide transport system substrate-binding protein